MTHLLDVMAISQQATLTDEKIEVYSRLLGDLGPRLLERTITLTCQQTKAPAGMLPTPSEIRSFIEEARTDLSRKVKVEWPKVNPRAVRDPHECDPEVAELYAQFLKAPSERDLRLLREAVGPARALLAKFNSYEALHVKCHAKIHPVCPVCAERWLYPVLNPMIVMLAVLYASETNDWSPYHKGFMRCATCPDVWGQYLRNPAA